MILLLGMLFFVISCAMFVFTISHLKTLVMNKDEEDKFSFSYNNYFKLNRLGKCNEEKCGKYSRVYQRALRKELKGKEYFIYFYGSDKCPHCNAKWCVKTIEKEEEYKFLKYSLQCPSLTPKTFLKYRKMVLENRKLMKEKEEMDEFMKHNNMDDDPTKWIKNILKDMEKEND